MKPEPKNKLIKLVDKSDDCAHWSAKDALQAMIDDIDKGLINPKGLCIHYWHKTDQGTEKPKFYVSGLDYDKHITLLNIGLRQVIDQWFGIE